MDMRRKRNAAMAPMPLVCTALYLVGMAVGAAYAKQADGEGYLAYFVSGYLKDHLAGTFAPVFSLSFLSVMAIHFLLLCFALSCVAAPFILALPCLKGFASGMIAATLYLQWGMRGILANAVLLWIPSVIQAILLILFCAEALSTSLALCHGALTRRGAYLGVSIPDTLEAFVLYSSAGLGAAVLEGVLSLFLGGLFQV